MQTIITATPPPAENYNVIICRIFEGNRTKRNLNTKPLTKEQAEEMIKEVQRATIPSVTDCYLSEIAPTSHDIYAQHMEEEQEYICKYRW